MDYLAIEKKWNKIWEDSKVYKFDKNDLKNKFYLLEMFSYPSGANLHIGHWWNFGLSDSYGRFKKLQGYNVFEPMGFDSFGLPAESYALKTGIHPEDSTKTNIDIMTRQLKEMGGMFDWEHEVVTCRPEYYKWTQWIFTKLFEKGLAYQKLSPVNWCPSCNTVIANEQVVDGVCERCDTPIERKNMTQWFFKITDYAERLLDGLDTLDWPEKTKILQKNWIGKSIGTEVDFKTDVEDLTLTVFTTRADTLYGVSWLVIAPDHKLTKKLIKPEQEAKVLEYIKESAKKDDILRTSTVAEKTGVFTGSYAINPLTNTKVPIYVADYVLSTYATGVVMGVAAHDTRDFQFAQKYNVPVIRVIEDKNGKESELPFTEYGKLVNSQEFTGLTSEEAKIKITEKLEKIGAGRKKVNYKFHDWSVSRQRYWGCPIPIIHCPHCGAVPVPEKDLPVVLPRISDYKPEGEGPLGKVEEYMNTTCPICGQPARRDPDTLDTFVCSSFYQLRYVDNKNADKIFDKDLVNAMLPVDTYVGGVEHATSHLLYSRFITKFLHDIGCINFDEPFKRLVHQGMILGSDGRKMSKRNGAKCPDEYINEFGSDVLRMFMMFSMNYVDGGPWKDENLVHIKAFVERLERIVLKWSAQKDENQNLCGDAEKELEYMFHNTIKCINTDFEAFSFNTGIARIMELVNAMYKYDTQETKNTVLMKEVAKNLLILVAPAIPHIAEELWEQIGEKYSIFNQKFPTFDESKLVKSSVEIAVQVNSKIVTRLMIDTSLAENEIVEFVKMDTKVASLIEGKTVVKSIVVKGRLVNLIVK